LKNHVLGPQAAVPHLYIAVVLSVSSGGQERPDPWRARPM
jgi:hypothetical protein